MHRELARVNIFCVGDWRERQRKKKNSVFLHRLWERNCSWAKQSSNTHGYKRWLTLCGRQTSCKRWHSAKRRVSWYLQKHRSMPLVLGTNRENSVFCLCSFSAGRIPEVPEWYSCLTLSPFSFPLKERAFVLLLPFHFVFLLIEMYTGLESAFERRPTCNYIVSIYKPTLISKFSGADCHLHYKFMKVTCS